MQGHKETLRNQLKIRRQKMSPEEMASLSQQIVRSALATIEWSTVQSLHIYQPMHALGEVDTAALFQTIWEQYPNIQIATWQKAADGHAAFWIHPDGIRAPAAVGQQFNAIMVPLLGFNDTGHRIGFGGGFYDRFLVTQPAAITIGLCYEFGYMPAFHPEAHDVPLTHIVTERRQL